MLRPVGGHSFSYQGPIYFGGIDGVCMQTVHVHVPDCMWRAGSGTDAETRRSLTNILDTYTIKMCVQGAAIRRVDTLSPVLLCTENLNGNMPDRGGSATVDTRLSLSPTQPFDPPVRTTIDLLSSSDNTPDRVNASVRTARTCKAVRRRIVQSDSDDDTAPPPLPHNTAHKHNPSGKKAHG